MRLIDADELKELICSNVYPVADAFNSRDYGMFWTGGIEKAIDDMPTVDPVKHGRWIHEVDTGVDMLKCSECSCRVVLYWYKLAVGTAGYEYCPYCGSKMDEEG